MFYDLNKLTVEEARNFRPGDFSLNNISKYVVKEINNLSNEEIKEGVLEGRLFVDAFIISKLINSDDEVWGFKTEIFCPGSPVPGDLEGFYGGWGLQVFVYYLDRSVKLFIFNGEVKEVIDKKIDRAIVQECVKD